MRSASTAPRTSASTALDLSDTISHLGHPGRREHRGRWAGRQRAGDAYDDFPVFAIDDGTNGREAYTNPAEACTYEMGGRQVALPAQTTLGGLQISRKVYVPACGPGFARFYNQVTNPTAGPVTITVYTAGRQEGGLGSDNDTVIEDSSAGPGVTFVADVLDTAVSWFTTSDGDPDPRRPGPGPQPRRRLRPHRQGPCRRRGPGGRPQGRPQLRLPGRDGARGRDGRLPLVRGDAVERRRGGRCGALHRRQPGRALRRPDRGGSGGDPELGRQRHRRRRGRPTRPTTASNAATRTRPTPTRTAWATECDNDTDGDGIANDVETAFGTNPLKADTDSDGVRDNADNCPKVAGAGVDGCPPATVVVNNVRRASKTKLKVSETTTGPVTIRAKGKVTLKVNGTKRAHDCTNGLAQVLVKVGKLTVSNKIVKLSNRCTFKAKVTLDQPRRLVKDVKVVGRFLGSDGLRPSKKTVKLD